ncbi:N-acetyltransferase family protein [Nocardia beijingensis]
MSPRPSGLPSGSDFRRYTAAQARERRDDVERIFRDSYIDAIESGETFESPDAFMHRFDAYTDPDRAGAFELVIARLDGELCGQAWGWPLTAKTWWWDGLELDQGDQASYTTENGSRTFAFSRIMVRKQFTGRGIARALHDELLEGRSEQRAALWIELRRAGSGSPCRDCGDAAVAHPPADADGQRYQDGEKP